MGNGKSRYISRFSAGSDGGSALNEDDFYSIEDSIIRNLTSQDTDGISQELIDSLRRDGVSIETELKGGTSEVENILGESSSTLIKLAEDMNDYDLNSLYRKLDSMSNRTPQQNELLDVLGDMGGRSFMRLSEAVKNISSPTKTMRVGGLDASEVNAAVNSSMYTLSTLVSLSKSSGMSVPSKLSFVDAMNKDARVSGYFNAADNSIHVLDFRNEGRNYSNSNWNIAGNYSPSIVSHEYGHFIHESLFRSKDNIVKGDTAVSTYGNYNQREAFAEAFSAYCFGVTPKQGKEYYSNFTSLMEKSGLSKFKGCLK